MRPVPGKGFRCPVCGKLQKPGTMLVHGAEERRNDKFDDIGLIDDPSKVDPAIHPIDDSQRCGGCGNWGAYYYLMQTSRADEPTTRFYKCTKCGKKWKKR